MFPFIKLVYEFRQGFPKEFSSNIPPKNSSGMLSDIPSGISLDSSKDADWRFLQKYLQEFFRHLLKILLCTEIYFVSFFFRNSSMNSFHNPPATLADGNNYEIASVAPSDISPRIFMVAFAS